MPEHVHEDVRRLLERDEVRVLLVDDDPAVVGAYGRALTRHGMTVVTAYGARIGTARFMRPRGDSS